MIQNYYITTSIIILAFFPFLSCTTSTNESQSKQDKVRPIIVEKPVDTDIEEINIVKIYNFKGYIDEFPISVVLQIEADSIITGTYQYDAYKKDINLVGELITCSDCGGEGTECQHLKLYENIDNENSATWFFECFDDCIYNYPEQYYWTTSGIWKDDSSTYEIALIASSSEYYLEPKSKLIFETKDKSDQFFSYHKIHNNEIMNKRFYIFSVNSGDLYESRLPTGLRLGVIDGMEPTMYTLNSEKEFIGDYNSFSLSDLPIKKLSSDDHVVVLDEMNQFRISNNLYTIDLQDLQDLNYYIMDEHTWLLENSGRVMGFFPVKPSMNLHSEPALNSNIICDELSENNGFIRISEIEMINLEYWAKVKFEYYTQLPCTDEMREAKAPVNGWIKLYDSEHNLTIQHTSGGC